MSYPDNSEQKKSKYGFMLVLFGLVVLIALVGLTVFLWSVNPILVLIPICIVVVLGVPAVVLIVLLVVIAEGGDDGWSGPGQFMDWSTVPKMRDRWPRDKL